MGTFYIGTSRYTRNPVRVPAWNASIRAGDDFKVALTVYANDGGDTAQVVGCNAVLALYRDDQFYPHSPDYGWAWFTGGYPLAWAGSPLVQSVGYATPVRGGGINFSLPQSVTAGLFGRYRMVIAVDLPDGSFSQVEGIVQIRGTCGLAAPLLLHTAGVFFTLDVSALDNAILAALVVNGVPCDMDGFPLLIITSVNGALSATGLLQLILNLPTVMPSVAGVLWLNNGVLSLSTAGGSGGSGGSVGALTGSASIVSAATGVLSNIGSGALSGVANIVSTAVGTLTRAAYLGPVATRSMVNNNTYNGSSAATMSRTYHYARDAITSLQVGYAHWAGNNGATGSIAEAVPSATVLMTGSVEYPAGTFTQLKWSGATSVNVTAGATLLSDAAVVSIPNGAKFYLRRYIIGTSWCYIDAGITSATMCDTANGDATAFAATDLTMSGTVTDAGSGTFAPPCAILAQTTKATVALIGDSRVQGARDSVDANVGDMGEFARSIGPTRAYLNLGIGGDTAAQFMVSANSARRRALSAYCTHVACNLGINDTTQFESLATIQSDLSAVYAMAGIVGKPIYQNTVDPGTTSTDSWATTTHQAAFSTDSVRVALNGWIRGNPAPLSGHFDTCIITESATNSGLWTAPGYTLDGVHPSPAGYVAIKNSTAALNPAVFT